jgi:hypothetical protein
MTKTISQPAVYQTVQTVPSATVENLRYIVFTDNSGRQSCGCRDFQYRGALRPCKHITGLTNPASVAAPVTEACDVCDLYGASADCRTCQGTGVISAVRS